VDRQIIGKIKDIIRYPVKSFHGEKLLKSKVESYGLYGDRSHVFIDETKTKKYLMATHFPELLGYQAEFAGHEGYDEYPKVKITTPSGKVYLWDDGAFIKEIKKIAGEHIYPLRYSPKYVPQGAIEEEHILIVTDSSLNKLENMWGKHMNYLRFRPNFIISMTEDIPFAEDSWFGKRMVIGNVELELKRHCERCMIINIDPNNLEKDYSLLKTVVRKRNNYFGVYATVISTGQISIGDTVYLDDKEEKN